MHTHRNVLDKIISVADPDPYNLRIKIIGGAGSGTVEYKKCCLSDSWYYHIRWQLRIRLARMFDLLMAFV